MPVRMEERSSLEAEAIKRKERLLELKRKRESGNEPEDNQAKEINDLPKPKFRSYTPRTDELSQNKLPDSKLVNVEDEIKNQLEAAKMKVVVDELDFTTLAPRKPDWDLKRDVAKKLEKVERRTQKAIAELIRDRLKERQQDLAAVVNASTLDNNK